MNGENNPYWDEDAHRAQRRLNAALRRQSGWTKSGKPREPSEDAIVQTMRLLGIDRATAIIVCRAMQ